MHARDEPRGLWVTEEDLSHNEASIHHGDDEGHCCGSSHIPEYFTDQDLLSGWAATMETKTHLDLKKIRLILVTSSTSSRSSKPPWI